MPKTSIKLRQDQLTWRQTSKKEAAICSCGCEKFFFVRVIDGDDGLEEVEPNELICSDCMAKYLV